MGHRYFVILKRSLLFCTYLQYLQVCFVFKTQPLCLYPPPYMHKTLPTLGNEKEQKQIGFYKKSLGQLIFSQVTKNLKII